MNYKIPGELLDFLMPDARKLGIPPTKVITDILKKHYKESMHDYKKRT